MFLVFIILAFVFVLVVAIVLAIVGVVIYNNLVKLRQNVKNAWSQIDVQLQRRFDLIPNLVETVKGYMEHENATLTKVTDLRNAWANASTLAEKARIDDQLSSAIKTIFAVSENYPDLKANQNFMQLQQELTNTEDKLSFSRQFYNDSVTKYNTKIELVPSNLVASMFHFKPEELFRVDSEEAKKNVKVDFNTKKEE